RWREFPVPNDFLGITKTDANIYEELPIAARCAMRWRSHRDQMSCLKLRLRGKIMVIQYESLFYDTAVILRNLEGFLNLSSAIPDPEIKISSLDKWKEQLTEVEIQQIESIVGFSPQSLPSMYGV
ncbi:MAG: hypothetical protein ACRD3F_01235, partial [Acidobacteriaceae bacterium]